MIIYYFFSIKTSDKLHSLKHYEHNITFQCLFKDPVLLGSKTRFMQIEHPWIKQLIEHSENKVVTQSGLFENEIGPEVLQSSVRQTPALQENQKHTPSAADVSILSLLREFLQIVFVERRVGALQV